MSKIIATIAALSTFAISANAGELTIPETTGATVIPMASDTTDWSGLYAGLTGSFVVDGTAQYIYDGVDGDFYDLLGSQYGGFVGYNVQRNNLVFGAELAVLTGDVYIDGVPNFVSDLSVDLKARVGYAAGSALIYGFAGGSMATWDNGGVQTNPNAIGFNYGAGIDLLVTEKLFVGVEYIMRDVSTDFNENTSGVQLTTSAIQVRAGMKF